MPEKEISVSPDGVSIKGEVVDDLRPVVRRVAKTADAVLRLLDNVVGLPADFVSNNLERFRQKYAARFEEIPVEDRRQPPMRIGCAVVKNVAYAADEPDIQEMFANLLAAASNTKLAETVHPGFATVIAELRAIDAVVLRYIEETAALQALGKPHKLVSSRGVSHDDFELAVSNLVRLGVLEWVSDGLARLPRTGFAGMPSFQILGTRQNVDPSAQLRKLAEDLTKVVRDASKQKRLQLTNFGRNFLRAVSEMRSDLP